MQQIILDGNIVPDEWHTLSEADCDNLSHNTHGQMIVPLTLWDRVGDQVSAHCDQLGLQVDGHTEPDEFVHLLPKLSLIAIHFASFADGRGYSLARLLRERYGFTGELRATGDILRDQLFYMHRCGFNAFSIRADRSIEDAVNALKDFSVTYQADVHEPRPHYQRQHG